MEQILLWEIHCNLKKLRKTKNTKGIKVGNRMKYLTKYQNLKQRKYFPNRRAHESTVHSRRGIRSLNTETSRTYSNKLLNLWSSWRTEKKRAHWRSYSIHWLPLRNKSTALGSYLGINLWTSLGLMSMRNFTKITRGIVSKTTCKWQHKQHGYQQRLDHCQHGE